MPCMDDGSVGELYVVLATECVSALLIIGHYCTDSGFALTTYSGVFITLRASERLGG